MDLVVDLVDVMSTKFCHQKVHLGTESVDIMVVTVDLVVDSGFIMVVTMMDSVEIMQDIMVDISDTVTKKDLSMLNPRAIATPEVEDDIASTSDFPISDVDAHFIIEQEAEPGHGFSGYRGGFGRGRYFGGRRGGFNEGYNPGCFGGFG